MSQLITQRTQQRMGARCAVICYVVLASVAFQNLVTASFCQASLSLCTAGHHGHFPDVWQCEGAQSATRATRPGGSQLCGSTCEDGILRGGSTGDSWGECMGGLNRNRQRHLPALRQVCRLPRGEGKVRRCVSASQCGPHVLVSLCLLTSSASMTHNPCDCINGPRGSFPS